MGNEDVGEVHLLLEADHQVEDLGLDGDIEGEDGLVADDELGLEGNGAGDADALALGGDRFEVEAFELDLARCGRIEVEQRLSEGGFPAAGLAHIPVEYTPVKVRFHGFPAQPLLPLPAIGKEYKENHGIGARGSIQSPQIGWTCPRGSATSR